jgi:MFS family permease
MRYHGLTLAQASVASGLTLGAVGIVSLVLGGMAADRARARGAHARLQLGTIALVLAAPLVLFALLLPPGAVRQFQVLMGIGWLLFYVYYVTVYPSIHDVVRPALRGTAMAVYFFWMYVLGGAFGTAILGMLSDRFARRAMVAEGASAMTESARATGLHDAFFIVPVLCFLLALVLLAASREMRKAQTV